MDNAKLELQEVVDFLKNPDKYTALGAKIPKVPHSDTLESNVTSMVSDVPLWLAGTCVGMGCCRGVLLRSCDLVRLCRAHASCEVRCVQHTEQKLGQGHTGAR